MKDRILHKDTEKPVHRDTENTVLIGGIQFSSRRLCRTVRVGGVPVLTVTAVWPEVVIEADADNLCDTKEETRTVPVPAPEDVARFQEGCRQVAQAFLDWGMGEPSDQAREAYEHAGPGAAYRFPRRELSCRLTVHPLPFDGMPEDLAGFNRMRGGKRIDGMIPFCLEREVYRGSRRREGGTIDRAYSLWAYPVLSPMRTGRQNRRKGEIKVTKIQ